MCFHDICVMSVFQKTCVVSEATPRNRPEDHTQERVLLLAGVLAGKPNLLDYLDPDPNMSTKCSHFSIWGDFWKFQNCGQVTATPRRSLLHAAKPSQMAYNAKNDLSSILVNEF
jgi:hypothetical protein